MDEAFLDLKPHPMVDLTSKFVVNMLDSSQFASKSSLGDISYTAGYPAMKQRLESLLELEPFVALNQGQSWPLKATGSGAEGVKYPRSAMNFQFCSVTDSCRLIAYRGSFRTSIITSTH